jgi:hypothetical protein
VSENTAADRLLILARAASRRLDEANDELNRAEVEHRIAWANYDAYVGKQANTGVK